MRQNVLSLIPNKKAFIKFTFSQKVTKISKKIKSVKPIG